MLGRVLAITRKEFLHIVRDPRTLAVIFLIPIVQLILLGYAATTDIDHLRTAVLDRDHSPASRALVDAYRASGYFEIIVYALEEADLELALDSGQVRAGLLIPPDYERRLARGEQAQVGFIVDGSDPSVANAVLGAAQSVGQAVALKMAAGRGLPATAGPALEVRPRVWYNPSLKSANFMIPGLMGMILQFLTMLLTALAIVRERELGTLEQLILTPIRPFELVIGKVVPYIGVAYWCLVEVLAIGVLWFGVPIAGSLPLLLALCGVFLLTSLGLGLLVSTVAHSQQEAMLLTWFFLLPTIFLSGFFFPIEAMPQVLQAISLVVPARYLLVILRGIVLKGVGIDLLWDEVLFLAVVGAVIFGLAAWRFRKHLE